MQVKIQRYKNMSFVGETASGHAVVMDTAAEHGGQNLAPRPMEMVLLGLGGCSSFDVVSILQKARQKVADCQLLISASRSDKAPKVFTHIKLEYTIIGSDLNPKQVARAVRLSKEKYCSVSKMLEHSATIEYSYKIVEQN